MPPIYSTAATILTQVRAETKVGSAPIATALQDTAMLRALHDFNSEFVNYPYNVGMLGWKFHQRETIISSIASTTINGALTSGTTTITLTSGTSWDSPSSDVGGGFVKIGTNIFDFFTFESRSGTALSTVAGINYAHATLSAAHKIYRLPAAYGKPRALFRQSNVLTYLHLDQDIFQVPPFGFYTIKTLIGTNYTGDFLVFPESVGALVWKFHYMIAPTTIGATTTSIDAPDGTPRKWILEKMKAYIWGVLGENVLAAQSEQLAAVYIQRALSEYSTHTIEPTTSIRLHW
jgi:hypothetical protein